MFLFLSSFSPFSYITLTLVLTWLTETPFSCFPADRQINKPQDEEPSSVSGTLCCGLPLRLLWLSWKHRIPWRFVCGPTSSQCIHPATEGQRTQPTQRKRLQLLLWKEDKVSSGETGGDLWGLLSLPLLCLSQRLPAGLPEILCIPKSTPETSCSSSILKLKVSVCLMQKWSFSSGYECALLHSTYPFI